MKIEINKQWKEEIAKDLVKRYNDLRYFECDTEENKDKHWQGYEGEHWSEQLEISALDMQQDYHQKYAHTCSKYIQKYG